MPLDPSRHFYRPRLALNNLSNHGRDGRFFPLERGKEFVSLRRIDRDEETARRLRVGKQ